MSLGRFRRRMMLGFGWGEMPASEDGRPARRVARLVADSCIAESSFCRACAERCPLRAIVFEGGRLRIDEARCDGCGECERVCPAPGGAMACVPKMERR